VSRECAHQWQAFIDSKLPAPRFWARPGGELVQVSSRAPTLALCPCSGTGLDKGGT
jgi:hypothetical protein